MYMLIVFRWSLWRVNFQVTHCARSWRTPSVVVPLSAEKGPADLDLRFVSTVWSPSDENENKKQRKMDIYIVCYNCMYVYITYSYTESVLITHCIYIYILIDIARHIAILMICINMIKYVYLNKYTHLSIHWFSKNHTTIPRIGHLDSW